MAHYFAFYEGGQGDIFGRSMSVKLSLLFAPPRIWFESNDAKLI